MDIVRAGAMGAAAPVNVGQWVHAPVNFQAWYFFKTFLHDFSFASNQFLHPSVEMSNRGTAPYPLSK